MQDYVSFRPSYPDEVLHFLRNELPLRESHVIADVGSGTGVLSRIFLENGNVVYGVEPNRAMREAAEEVFHGQPRFHSIDGRAESTNIETGLIDFVVVGQAFHWFDVDPTRKEFARILRSNGWVVLIWNTRRTETTPFLRAYEGFLERWGTDYADVRRRHDIRTALGSFFSATRRGSSSFENVQSLAFSELQGRLLSSSYIPGRNHPNYEPMLGELQDLFDANQEEGKVRLEYDTELFYGSVD